MDLDVARHDEVRSVQGLVDEWRQLHRASGDTNPFCGPEWPATWIARFADGTATEPYVLEVREHGRLVAVAPLARRTVLRGAARVIAPIGVGQPWVMPFELPTLLVAPEQGRKAIRAVIGYLGEHSSEWDVARLMLGDTAAYFEPEWLPDFTFTQLPRRSRAVPVIELGADVDIYAGRRNLKESFRRARNRLTRDFGADGWSVRRLEKRDDVTAGLRTLSDLHRGRSEMQDGEPLHPDVLADPRVRDYVTEAVALMADDDAAWLYELTIGPDVVASQLVLRTSTASYFSLTGAGKQAWQYSAITYLQSRAVEDARAAGHRLVQLSTGPNQTKMRWTSTVQVHPEFWIIGPRRRSSAYYVAEELASVLASYREARQAHRA